MVYEEGSVEREGAETKSYRRFIISGDGSISSTTEVPNLWNHQRDCGKATPCNRLEDTPLPPSERREGITSRLYEFRAEGWWQAYPGTDDGLCVEYYDRNMNASTEGFDVFLPRSGGPIKSIDSFEKDVKYLTECRLPKTSRAKDAFHIEDFDLMRTSPDGAYSIYCAAPIGPGDYAHGAYFLYDERNKNLFAIVGRSLSREWKKEEIVPFLKLWVDERLIGANRVQEDHFPAVHGVEEAPRFAGPVGHLIASGDTLFAPELPRKFRRGDALHGECPFDRMKCAEGR
jgi:hypothetical protein